MDLQRGDYDCHDPSRQCFSLRKTYSNYEVLDTYPWLGLSHKCIAQSKINRIPPQKATCFDERRFLSILGMAVNTVYNDTATPQDALTYAIQSYNRTMK